LTWYKTDAEDFFKGKLTYKTVVILFGTLTKYYDECGNEVGRTYSIIGKGFGFCVGEGSVTSWSKALQ